MKRDSEAMEGFRSAVGARQDGVRVRTMGEFTNTETIHIRGIDGVTEKEELVKAMEGKLNCSLKNIDHKLSALRPFTNGTKVVTLTINKKDAEMMTKKGLWVGIAPCLVERRVKVRRCFTCWGFDPLAAECKGPERTRCHNCGEEGHMAEGCQGEEFCVLCKKKGHRTKSGRCGLFKRALSAARRADRQNSRQNSTRGADTNGDIQTDHE